MLTMKLTPMMMTQPQASIEEAISVATSCNDRINVLSRDVYDGMMVNRVFWSNSQLGFLSDTRNLLITANRSGVQVSLIQNSILGTNDDEDVSLIRRDGSHAIWKRGEIAESYIGAKIANLFFSEPSVAYLYFYSRLPLRICVRVDEVSGGIVLYWEESQ